MHNYLISGLHVSSEMELPGAVGQSSPSPVADVSVRRAAVPTSLGDGAERGPNWEMDARTVLLRIPRLARLLIAQGREIVVELHPGATEQDASAYVLGTAFGILLHQRGTLVLHGAAVARNGEAIAICGQSGAGKSTLAAALCRSGATFVTDDICAVTFNSDRRPLVIPDGRRLKLWQESIEKLDFAEQRGDAVRAGFEKYFVAPPSIMAREPLPLRAIYLLRQARPPLQEGIEAIDLAEAMAALDREAYRPVLRAKMDSIATAVGQGAMMMGHVKIFRLIRPRGFESLADTVSALLRHWDGLAQ